MSEKHLMLYIYTPQRHPMACAGGGMQARRAARTLSFTITTLHAPPVSEAAWVVHHCSMASPEASTLRHVARGPPATGATLHSSEQHVAVHTAPAARRWTCNGHRPSDHQNYRAEHGISSRPGGAQAALSPRPRRSSPVRAGVAWRATAAASVRPRPNGLPSPACAPAYSIRTHAGR